MSTLKTPTAPAAGVPRGAVVASARVNPRLEKAPSRQGPGFRLGCEEYGVDILRVQEIRSFETCTHLANGLDMGLLENALHRSGP